MQKKTCKPIINFSEWTKQIMRINSVIKSLFRKYGTTIHTSENHKETDGQNKNREKKHRIKNPLPLPCMTVHGVQKDYRVFCALSFGIRWNHNIAGLWFIIIFNWLKENYSLTLLLRRLVLCCWIVWYCLRSASLTQQSVADAVAAAETVASSRLKLEWYPVGLC